MHFKRENKGLELRKYSNSYRRLNLKSGQKEIPLKKSIKWMSVLVRRLINLYVKTKPKLQWIRPMLFLIDLQSHGR